jgi:hypothetical protein
VSGTTRAQVMSAILAKISAMTFSTPINGASSWVTVSDRRRVFADVSSDQQPAIFLITYAEEDAYRNLGVLRRRLDLRMVCLCRTDSSPGQPLLDLMMQAFEATFNVADNYSTNANTLGGLVYWCRIEGKVFKDPGDLDNQALMVVPLLVEMP